VTSGDLADQRQPKATAAAVLAGLFETIEGLEDALAFGRRYAGPVVGDFQRGAVVGCVDPGGREVARGLVNYSAEETRRIMRRSSGEIEGILGYVGEPELIHRDNLVLL